MVGILAEPSRSLQVQNQKTDLFFRPIAHLTHTLLILFKNFAMRIKFSDLCARVRALSAFNEV